MQQGWIHPKTAWVGCQRLCPGVALSSWLYLWNVSPFSRGCLCLLWDEVDQKRNGRTRSRASENRGVKVQNQHRLPAMSLEMEKSKLSIIVSAPKCYNLWHVPGHSCTPWHQGRSLWMTHHGEGPYFQPWYPSAYKCLKIKKNLSFIGAI